MPCTVFYFTFLHPPQAMSSFTDSKTWTRKSGPSQFTQILEHSVWWYSMAIIALEILCYTTSLLTATHQAHYFINWLKHIFLNVPSVCSLMHLPRTSDSLEVTLVTHGALQVQHTYIHNICLYFHLHHAII